MRFLYLPTSRTPACYGCDPSEGRRARTPTVDEPDNICVRSIRGGTEQSFFFIFFLTVGDSSLSSSILLRMSPVQPSVVTFSFTVGWLCTQAQKTIAA